MTAVRWRCLAALAIATTGLACEREARRYTESAARSSRFEGVRQTDFQPGRPNPAPLAANPYQGNAWAAAEGKRFYVAFNCSGCHALGGGGIGPALMDDKWIYGSAPAQIYSSIVEGRANGMPAFGGRIPDQQVWQIVTFVQSMSGLLRQDVAPGRDDDMSAKKPELRMERPEPRQTGHR